VRIGLVPRGQDLDRLPVLEREAQVLHAAVRPYEHGLVGELRPDRARGVETRGAVGEFEFGLVGKDGLHEQPGYGTTSRGRPQRGTGRVAGAGPGAEPG